jgi:excisionase family DNA binding protein
MPSEPLRAAEAARQLGVSTKELLRLACERQIRFVMVDGVVHFPEDAIADYRAKAS